MRAKQFTEAAIGTNPKRPARAGSRPNRGHSTSQYQVVCDGTKKGIFQDKDEAILNAKSMFKHEKEYYHIAVVDLGSKEEVWSWDKKQVIAEVAMERLGRELVEHKKGVIAKKYTKKPVNPSNVHQKAKEKLAAIKPLEEQFCEDCGGSLAEHGKASRALCTSSKPDNDLGASNLSSCKSQGLRARDGKKSHKLGKSPKSRITVGGHRIKGQKYGGPLPDWS